MHEHTIASIIVSGPSFLDNGDFIIELENEAGKERRVLNVQFQTEEEYNANYFRKYLVHKENLKYHRYQPGETRWEDIVPEVKEFVFWEPPEEEVVKKVAAPGKIRKKRKKRILKKVMTPWGDEQEVEVTDEEGSEESYETDDKGDDEDAEEEEDEDDDPGWNVEGEVNESETDASVVDEHITAQKPPGVVEEPAPSAESASEPVEEPVVAEPVGAEPESEFDATELEPESIKAEPEIEPVQEVFEEEIVVPEAEEQHLEEESPIEDGAYGEEQQYEEEYFPVEEDYEPYVRKEPEVEHPIILRRPKFSITDFQLRKKFYFVNKLIDAEIMKGKTLRMQSLSSSIGPVTCEWRHNGRLVKAPTARKSIEFYPIRNQAILEIENLRVQDSGTYQCIHYNNYTEPLIDSCKIIVTVPQPKETADQPPTFTRLLTGINHYRFIKL